MCGVRDDVARRLHPADPVPAADLPTVNHQNPFCFHINSHRGTAGIYLLFLQRRYLYGLQRDHSENFQIDPVAAVSRHLHRVLITDKRKIKQFLPAGVPSGKHPHLVGDFFPGLPPGQKSHSRQRDRQKAAEKPPVSYFRRIQAHHILFGCAQRPPRSPGTLNKKRIPFRIPSFSM